MEAIWIINLSSDGNYSKFYQELKENYCTATMHNFDNLLYEDFSDRFKQDGEQTVDDIIEKFIDNEILNLGKRWQFFSNLGVHDKLRIFIIGDMDESITCGFFHLLPAKIRDFQRGLKAFKCNVFITGLLSYAHDAHQKISDEQVLFLTQLNMLQKNSIRALIPYHEIFFFQKPVHNVENHYVRLSHFLLFISLNDNRTISDYSYNTAGTAGVYYESDIQGHNEAATLSAILLNSFTTAKSHIFYEPVEAEKHVKNAPFFKNGRISYQTLTNDLISSATQPDFEKDDKNKSRNPVRHMFSASIITDYYMGFIPKLIQRLVNDWGTYLVNSYEKFKIVLQQNKFKVLNTSATGIGLRNEISDVAFDVFKNPKPNCSLEQQRAIIEELKKSVETTELNFHNSTETDGDVFAPYSIPGKYKDAYSRARQKLINEGQVLKDLEGDLKTHPVFSAKFIRGALVSITLLVILGPTLAWMAEHRIFDFGPLWFIKPILYALSFIVPFIFLIIQVKWLLNRISRYQTEYKACLLHTINEKAKEDVINTISEIYKDLEIQCDILEKKRKRAVKHVRQVDYLENRLKPNDLFQPLWATSATTTNDSISVDIGKSGQFNGKNILSSFPGYKLRHNDHEIHFLDLIEDEPSISGLIQEMMNEPAPASLDGRTRFVKTSSVDAILLLDVSGSMTETLSDGKSKIDHLRTAVKSIDKDDIKWAAFADEVYRDGSGNTVFGRNDDIPEPSGETALYKAFDHLNANRFLGFEKIILISDGLPQDEASAITSAKATGIPVDVIYLGNDTAGKDFMQKISEGTSGKMVSANEANLMISLQKAFTIEISGRTVDLKFWELMKMGYYPECAWAALEFAKNKIVVNDLNVNVLLENYFNADGIQAWLQSTAPSCSLRPGTQAIQFKKFYTGKNPIVSSEILQMINAEHMTVQDSLIVEIIQSGVIPDLCSLLIDLNPEKVKYVLSKNLEKRTTKICKDILGDSAAQGIFPDADLKL